MVLVDTSIWIRFLANQTPCAAELDRLLAFDEVTAHELVYGELLIRDNDGRRVFLASYERMQQTMAIRHRDAVAFVLARNLYGRGIGWSDVHLLASAIVGQVKLWTADQRLAVVAEELGVAHNSRAA